MAERKSAQKSGKGDPESAVRAGSEIYEVAMPAPLPQLFSYLPPLVGEPPQPGARVLSPFGSRSLVGVVVAVRPHSEAGEARLKRIERVLDSGEPSLSDPIMQLARWAQSYYHHPLGQVLAAVLPPVLRAARGRETEIETAPASTEGLTLVGRGHELNEAQGRAVDAIAGVKGHARFLLDGVTSSGKTEVYMQSAMRLLSAGGQALVLVPEIGLTMPLAEKFVERFGGEAVAVLHSGVSPVRRLRIWQGMREGRLRILIGTRLAVFTPAPQLRLLVVDEEHDSSFKQQQGFRYNARDLALLRAKNAGIVAVLGSATPSLESCAGVESGRLRSLRLLERAGRAVPPEFSLIDMRRDYSPHGLSQELLRVVEQHLAAGDQVLLYVNRRGHSPILTCGDCGLTVLCPRCDLAATVHKDAGELRCHHCGHRQSLLDKCSGCGSDNLKMLGFATQKVSELIRELFPEYPWLRIDRDSVGEAAKMEEVLKKVRESEQLIMIGTQILAKGHDFPRLNLVGVLDADRGLYGTDFRAQEEMGQLLVQVAGRAGRRERPGRVLVQTFCPEHPLLRMLVAGDYGAFARHLLERRRRYRMPPHYFMGLVRAESFSAGAAERFLRLALDRCQVQQGQDLIVQGPVPAPVERMDGRHRWQILVRASSRSLLQRQISQLEQQLRAGDLSRQSARGLRWTLDIDPLTLF